jgi:hypothetical protein
MRRTTQRSVCGPFLLALRSSALEFVSVTSVISVSVTSVNLRLRNLCESPSPQRSRLS